jgi:hypothetical protein
MHPLNSVSRCDFLRNIGLGGTALAIGSRLPDAA